MRAEGPVALKDYQARLVGAEQAMRIAHRPGEGRATAEVLAALVWGGMSGAIAFCVFYIAFQLSTIASLVLTAAVAIAGAFAGWRRSRAAIASSARRGDSSTNRAAFIAIERYFRLRAREHVFQLIIAHNPDADAPVAVLNALEATLGTAGNRAITFPLRSLARIGSGWMAAKLFDSECNKRGRELLIQSILKRIEATHGSLTELIVNSDLPSAAAAIAHEVTEETGYITIRAALEAMVECAGGKDRLKCSFDRLKASAASVVSLRGGFGVDRALSPQSREIGLPLGDADPLAPLVREFMPGATLFRSFDPNAIEIVYDARNLAAEDLASHQRTKRDWLAASDLERKVLFPFPRRYVARSEKVVEVGTERFGTTGKNAPVSGAASAQR